MRTRRELIVDALLERMLAQGFAATTLADVARAARMTPSHLLYYFRGKEDILAACFEGVTAQITTGLAALDVEPVERRLDRVAEYFFGGKLLHKTDLGITLEFFGLAVHDKVLHQTKAQFDRMVKAWLSHTFAQYPRAPGRSPADAAEAAYALIVGLSTSAFFDERLGFARAHALLRESLHQLAGTSPPGKAAS
ncbi:MAG TPA: TetR/AcrR family transcriptional regulator [Myxococcota bacterium]|nr:TetR/AcrR family transcriptional regulator [Myxococcota bacterium]